MRQAGTLPTEREAQRFAAWLVSQRIEAHAEAEGAAWTVWVRDEDRLPEAREALAHFLQHPADAQYQGAEQSAEAAHREAEARRQQAQGNVVEMRGRWGAGAAGNAWRDAPLSGRADVDCPEHPRRDRYEQRHNERGPRAANHRGRSTAV